MQSTREVLTKRFEKLHKHYLALKDYKDLIEQIVQQKNIFDPLVFQQLKVEEKAFLDAYLKRFSSMQDFMGAKIFNLLLENAGMDGSRMSEVLYHIEREQIIDSLDRWIALREIRNELEHDYPENLEQALQDLKFCVDNFTTLERYYLNARQFAKIPI